MPEYNVWKTMINRCHMEGSSGYDKYGAKGVTVCDRWRNNFDDFIADMGLRPGKGFTIERLDVFGNYEPENCVWMPAQMQGWNKRKSKLNHKDAETIRSRRAQGETLKSIADDFGIHLSMVSLIARGKCWPATTEI